MIGLVNKLLQEERAAEGADLLAVSDHAIRFIVIKTLTEPENVSQIEDLEGPKSGKCVI